MACCAYDGFSGCGCDCGEIKCLQPCDRCGMYVELDMCTCDDEEDDYILYGYYSPSEQRKN